MEESILSQPLVSIVIPIKNMTPFVIDAIQSILKQSYTNYEILYLHDDLSNNDLIDLRRMSEGAPSIFFINTSHTKNLAEALNLGIVNCEGKYFVRFDSDDLMLNDRIQKQVAFLERHLDYCVVGGQRFIIDERGDFLIKPWPYPRSDRAIRRRLTYQSPIPHPGSTIRVDTLINVSGYDPDFLAGEDYELWLRLMNHGKMANLKDVILGYRIHKHNKSLSDGNILWEWDQRARVKNDATLSLKSKNLKFFQGCDVINAYSWKFFSHFTHKRHAAQYKKLVA